MTVICCCVIGGVGAAAQSATPSTPDALRVATLAGAVGGAKEEGVLSFKGIPFAAPPVGPLRWRPPAPAVAWSGVRDAKGYAPDCMQRPFAEDAAPLRTTSNEDCLYLNVWRPEGNAVNLPVMVWIYGGGFVNGGTSPAVYDGARFARDGVILVSFNYRLGRFGFFGFPALSSENPDGPLGNYGYMDQIAALKWVRDNITAFGGDPHQVTIFGESAGGGSVHMLLNCAQARGLFARAIVESGGGRGNLRGPRSLREDLQGSPSAETIGVNFARSKGINGTDEAALQKLRSLEVGDIVDGLSLGSPTEGPPTYSGPMEDGTIVTMSPGRAYKAGVETQVPVMLGANDLDIGLFFPKDKTEAFSGFGRYEAAARKAYDPGGSTPLPVIAWEIGMDRMMIEPARFVARELSDRGLQIYEYRFSYVAPAMTGILEKMGFAHRMPFKGAPHASEIPFAFDTVGAAYGAATTTADLEMAKSVHAYWVNFAKTGNPNGDGLTRWPAYRRKADVLLNFTERGPVAMRDPRRARLDATARAAELASHD
jgi:para-nitrobenzyl esterase